jgi:hypothetical protein
MPRSGHQNAEKVAVHLSVSKSHQMRAARRGPNSVAMVMRQHIYNLSLHFNYAIKFAVVVKA